jgi:hypothetical protein
VKAGTVILWLVGGVLAVIVLRKLASVGALGTQVQQWVGGVENTVTNILTGAGITPVAANDNYSQYVQNMIDSGAITQDGTPVDPSGSSVQNDPDNY